MNPSDKINTLRRDLHAHNHAYYVLCRPVVSDTEYDRLYAELVRLEEQFPALVEAHSPTQRIGAPIAAAQKVRHGVRMLSLRNTYTADEVFAALGKSEVIIEPKIDGASLKLIYRGGRLRQALTRGDGSEGEDVTVAAKAILSIPLQLLNPVNIDVVGEVYMRNSVFDRLNAERQNAGEELLANPRNAAAGSLKLKDPAAVKERRLSFVAYGSTTHLPDVRTHSDLTDKLRDLRLPTIYTLPTTNQSEVEPRRYLLAQASALAHVIRETKRMYDAMDLQMDGLVFKINSLDRQRDLGEGTKYPNYAVAYKFPPEQKQTTLVAITLQVGRTGKITPVAELRPVSLGGTTVKRASLCNGNEIKRLGINVGDDVLVEKSAEIIPKVMALACKKSDGVYAMPDRCPSCQGKLEQPKGYVDVYCTNRSCYQQVYARLLHACSKSALDIDGCGDAMVRDLIDHGVRSLHDLFTISSLDFLKPVARAKFEAGREKAKIAPLWRKLHALGIDGLGSTLCQDIAARWPNFGDAIETLSWGPADIAKRRKAGQPHTTLHDIIGPVNATELVRWLGANVDEIADLERAGFHLNQERNAKNARLAGKVFCITGTLTSGQRAEVQERIMEAGGIVKGSVGKAVNYLVVGLDAGRTKTDAAAKYGAKLITEEQLYEMMGQPIFAEDKQM